MLYHFLYPLRELFFIFNVLRYITFRSGAAFLFSFIFVLGTWKYFLPFLSKLKAKENVNMYGHNHLEELHKTKTGTPTMGGLLIIASVLSSIFLWARLDYQSVLYSIFAILGFGVIGFIDDYRKIVNKKGISRKAKLLAQISLGIILGIMIYFNPNFSREIYLPFFKNITFNLGIGYIFWSCLILTATSNAVNFTDGLDGLAIGNVISSSLIFGLLSYLVGHKLFADYLFIPYVEQAGELAVVCASLVGAGLGFLWFNCHPAQIFMGDVGALSLGGIIGLIALLSKQEFLLLIAGGIFVFEALSVVLQMCSLRYKKKRIFKAAPWHHHLQLLGWSESKIVIRIWIISFILAVLAIMTLKIR